jgi:hypothetical protein
MILLTAAVSDHGFTYTLAREGQLLLTTGNRLDAAEFMLQLSIDNPLQLIQAAEQWGAVDVHETALSEDDES